VVYPAGGVLVPKTRAFVDVLQPWFKYAATGGRASATFGTANRAKVSEARRNRKAA